MIYKVKYSSKFKKNYKLAKKRGMDVKLLEEIIDKLRRRIPLEKRYKDHELQGKYKGFRECHIQPDWLLVYYVEDDVLVLTLVDTGTHADLFE